MHIRQCFVNRCSALVILSTVLVLPGCTLARATYYGYFHSPDSLPKFSETLPIYAEKGAESMAGDIAAALPTVIRRIEATHGGKLKPLPPIVVCITEACYDYYAAEPVAAAEAMGEKRISINGAKILKEKRDVVQLFTHEVSHFYWHSQGISAQPRWFEEGMGVWVSDGGGAETVSVQAAEQAIRSGTTIHPTLNTGFWNYLTKSPSPPENSWNMYYRQAGMFIQHLHDSDPIAFSHLLEALRNTKDLQQAWPVVYKESLDVVWLHFVGGVRGKSTK